MVGCECHFHHWVGVADDAGQVELKTLCARRAEILAEQCAAGGSWGGKLFFVVNAGKRVCYHFVGRFLRFGSGLHLSHIDVVAVGDEIVAGGCIRVLLLLKADFARCLCPRHVALSVEQDSVARAHHRHLRQVVDVAVAHDFRNHGATVAEYLHFRDVAEAPARQCRC